VTSLKVNGQIRSVDVDPWETAATGAARGSEPHRDQVRLRSRRLRSLPLAAAARKLAAG